VKWMMYWIVFAVFSSIETLIDPLLLFWFPFYSEIKIILLLYLVSPVTKGSGIVYRRFLHPVLCNREEEIDAVLCRAKEQGYQKVSAYATRGLSWVASSILSTAIRGGGTVLTQIRRSYSMLDVSDLAELAFRDEVRFQDVTEDSNQDVTASTKLKRRQMRKDDVRSRHPLQRSADMMGSAESLSSGYCSDSLFPVDSDTMDTQDYELWERKRQIRASPKNNRRQQPNYPQDFLSDEDDNPYENLNTPFGAMSRAMPGGVRRSDPAGGAVSPDVCSSYYPSDAESDDDEPSQDSYVLRAGRGQAQQLQQQPARQSPRTVRHMADPRLSLDPQKPQQQDLSRMMPVQQSKRGEQHSMQLRSSVDRQQDDRWRTALDQAGTVPGGEWTNPARESRESRLGKEPTGLPDMTMEELQQMARQLNVELVSREDSNKPSVPKRLSRSGQKSESKGIEPLDLEVCSNQESVMLSNTTIDLLNPVSNPTDLSSPANNTQPDSELDEKTGFDATTVESTNTNDQAEISNTQNTSKLPTLENPLTPSKSFFSSVNNIFSTPSFFVQESKLEETSNNSNDKLAQNTTQNEKVDHLNIPDTAGYETSDSEYYEPDEDIDEAYTIEKSNTIEDKSKINLEQIEDNPQIAENSQFFSTSEDNNPPSTIDLSNDINENILENVSEESKIEEVKCSNEDFKEDGKDFLKPLSKTNELLDNDTNSSNKSSDDSDDISEEESLISVIQNKKIDKIDSKSRLSTPIIAVNKKDVEEKKSTVDCKNDGDEKRETCIDRYEQFDEGNALLISESCGKEVIESNETCQTNDQEVKIIDENISANEIMMLNDKPVPENLSKLEEKSESFNYIDEPFEIKEDIKSPNEDQDTVIPKIKSVKKSRAPLPPQPVKEQIQSDTKTDRVAGKISEAVSTNPFEFDYEDENTKEFVDDTVKPPTLGEHALPNKSNFIKTVEDSIEVTSEEKLIDEPKIDNKVEVPENSKNAALKDKLPVSRLTVKSSPEEGHILYQSPGYSTNLELNNPTSYPALAADRPMSPELRLKRSLSPLTEPIPELIKEKPVPLSYPTKVITNAQGITRIRTYSTDKDTGQSKEDADLAGITVPVEDTTASASSRCPHCTIHNWLPHSPQCPKLKKK